MLLDRSCKRWFVLVGYVLLVFGWFFLVLVGFWWFGLVPIAYTLVTFVVFVCWFCFVLVGLVGWFWLLFGFGRFRLLLFYDGLDGWVVGVGWLSLVFGLFWLVWLVLLWLVLVCFIVVSVGCF